MPAKLLVKERAWGTRYDTLGSSPPPSPPIHHLATEHMHTAMSSTFTPEKAATITGSSPLQTPEKTDPNATPHDASIFVGSLPANVDQGELNQRLTDHLSIHPQIKAIKVVRDIRGGVCAFVQCASPSSAGDLLQTLQTNPPRPFLGRFLRFEPAKAFRTLLVSYRIPVGFLSANHEVSPSSLDGLSVSVHLAHMMRIYRPRNAKYLSLLYDADALNFDADTSDGNSDDSTRDVFSGDGLLLNPLTYDEETLRKLAVAFGPLESFKECCEPEAPGPLVDQTSPHASYPYPHSAPRSSEMAKGLWEIKWKDREDSVAALLTLRRVPHLSVSWAHHPPTSGSPSAGPHKTNLFLPSSPWGSPVGRTGHPDGRRGARQGNHLAHTGVGYPPVMSPITARQGETPVSQPNDEEPSRLQWPVGDSPTRSPYPPGTRWADQVSDLDLFDPTPSLATAQASTPLIPFTGDSAPSGAGIPLNERAPATGTSVVNEGGVRSQTPQHGASRRTEYGTPTRYYGRGDSPRWALTSRRNEMTEIGTGSPLSHDGTREVDPTTVFVGGLESDSWDEHRLRRIFDHFGSIENIHLVKPLNKRSAFAFVKFSNTQSAGQAVQEQHNRTYDGRPIRVQLRDRNPPPRGLWRPPRGRGRGLLGNSPHRASDLVTNCVPGIVHALDGSGSPAIGQTDAASRASREEPMNISPTRTVHGIGDLRETLDVGLRARSWQDGLNASASISSTSSGTTKVPSVQNESSQGPPSPTASPTPPPSSASVVTSASSSAPIPPYHMNMGFFPPQPWSQPYASPYSYPFPVVPGFGYVGYPYPPVHPMAAQGEHAAGSNATSPGWTTNVLDNTSKDAGDVSSSASGHQQMGQPPLRATGFIRNEQGALVPVYQREALDEYMANAHGRQPSHVSSGVPPQHAPHVAAINPTWHQPSFAMYPGAYPLGMAPMNGAAPSLPPATQQRFWMPGQAPYGVPAYTPPGQLAMSAPLVPGATSTVPMTAYGGSHVSSGHAQPHMLQYNGPPHTTFQRRSHYQVEGAGVQRPPSARMGDRGGHEFRGSARGHGR